MSVSVHTVGEPKTCKQHEEHEDQEMHDESGKGEGSGKEDIKKKVEKEENEEDNVSTKKKGTSGEIYIDIRDSIEQKWKHEVFDDKKRKRSSKRGERRQGSRQ